MVRNCGKYHIIVSLRWLHVRTQPSLGLRFEKSHYMNQSPLQNLKILTFFTKIVLPVKEDLTGKPVKIIIPSHECQK